MRFEDFGLDPESTSINILRMIHQMKDLSEYHRRSKKEQTARTEAEIKRDYGSNTIIMEQSPDGSFQMKENQ